MFLDWKWLSTPVYNAVKFEFSVHACSGSFVCAGMWMYFAVSMYAFTARSLYQTNTFGEFIAALYQRTTMCARESSGRVSTILASVAHNTHNKSVSKHYEMYNQISWKRFMHKYFGSFRLAFVSQPRSEFVYIGAIHWIISIESIDSNSLFRKSLEKAVYWWRPPGSNTNGEKLLIFISPNFHFLFWI